MFICFVGSSSVKGFFPISLNILLKTNQLAENIVKQLTMKGSYQIKFCYAL